MTRKCRICKTGKLTLGCHRTIAVAGVWVLASGDCCDDCGEIFIADGELERLELEAADEIEKRGIRTRTEARFVRTVRKSTH